VQIGCHRGSCPVETPYPPVVKVFITIGRLWFSCGRTTLVRVITTFELVKLVTFIVRLEFIMEEDSMVAPVRVQSTLPI
jgi:hypothetical protein